MQRPLLDRAVLESDVDVVANVRIRPPDFRDDAFYAAFEVSFEFRYECMVSSGQRQHADHGQGYSGYQ